MRLLVVTFAPSIRVGDEIYSYEPYVREMDLWFQHATEVRICSPSKYSYGNMLQSTFRRTDIEVISVPELSCIGWRDSLATSLKVPFVIYRLIRSFFWADHLHFRAPGNISLLGLIVQILFPAKRKTAKYAGNWGQNNGQPWSYNLQKWILKNPFLTRNMKVLVYGEWPNQSKNVVPFFTASFSADEAAVGPGRRLDTTLRLAFVGTLTKGKNPLLTIKVAHELRRCGIQVTLDVLGDGADRGLIEDYINQNNLTEFVILHGNVSREEVKRVLQRSDFLVFLSDSEGWPKAVAEAMFWGCVPVTRAVSCVPWMLNDCERGLLIDSTDPCKIALAMLDVYRNRILYLSMSKAAFKWSRQYTLERFESEIRRLL